MCRFRRELSNAYLIAKVAFYTAVNEPCKVCPLSAYRSPRSFSSDDEKAGKERQRRRQVASLVTPASS